MKEAGEVPAVRLSVVHFVKANPLPAAHSRSISDTPLASASVLKSEVLCKCSGPKSCRSRAERHTALSGPPVNDVLVSAGVRRGVQSEPSPLPKHLLLQLDDVVPDVRHHEQEEVKGAWRARGASGAWRSSVTL